jgi:hypothetical protein
MSGQKTNKRLPIRSPMTPKQVRTERRRHLAFALKLAETDVAKLTESEWDALREQLTTPRASEFMVADSHDELDQAGGVWLSTELKSKLEDLLNGKTWQPPLTGTVGVQMQLKPRPRRIFIASPNTAALLNVADWLAAEGSRLRRCAKCKRLFVKVKGGRYCSIECSRARRYARFVRRHGHDELSRRRRNRYHKWVEREKGPAIARVTQQAAKRRAARKRQ